LGRRWIWANKDNIGVGDYHATVVDFYGDFTANTICSLTAETTTTSTTSTTTTTYLLIVVYV
jgi:hypothetical protein